MSDPESARRITRLQTAAYVLAASVIGLPLLVGVLAQAIFAQLTGGIDPADIGYQLAIGVPFIAAAAGILIAILRVFGLLVARSGDRAALRYPILIVQLQIGFTVAIIVLVLLTPGL